MKWMLLPLIGLLFLTSGVADAGPAKNWHGMHYRWRMESGMFVVEAKSMIPNSNQWNILPAVRSKRLSVLAPQGTKSDGSSWQEGHVAYFGKSNVGYDEARVALYPVDLNVRMPQYRWKGQTDRNGKWTANIEGRTSIAGTSRWNALPSQVVSSMSVIAPPGSSTDGSDWQDGAVFVIGSTAVVVLYPLR